MFNGEFITIKNLESIYLQKELFHLKKFRHETLLQGLSIHGLDFLKKINGQFSIFFIDFNKSKLT